MVKSSFKEEWRGGRKKKNLFVTVKSKKRKKENHHFEKSDSLKAQQGARL